MYSSWKNGASILRLNRHTRMSSTAAFEKRPAGNGGPVCMLHCPGSRGEALRCAGAFGCLECAVRAHGANGSEDGVRGETRTPVAHSDASCRKAFRRRRTVAVAAAFGLRREILWTDAASGSRLDHGRFLFGGSGLSSAAGSLQFDRYAIDRALLRRSFSGLPHPGGVAHPAEHLALLLNPRPPVETIPALHPSRRVDPA
jgi:hypothetical protein